MNLTTTTSTTSTSTMIPSLTLTTSSTSTSADIFDSKIKDTKSQFSSVLDDFKKYYVYYNKNPEVNEFQNYYFNSKSQIKTLSKQLYQITESINKTIQDLDNSMSQISDKIEKEKSWNLKTTKILNNILNSKNGSKIMINDVKTDYNTQFYNNLELVFGIAFMSILISLLIKNKH